MRNLKLGNATTGSHDAATPLKLLLQYEKLVSLDSAVIVLGTEPLNLLLLMSK